MNLSKSIELCSASLLLAVLLCQSSGCVSTPPDSVPQDASQAPPTPTDSDPSNIPAGIYTGDFIVTETLTMNGNTAETESTLPYSLVIDENGRLLSADGAPFQNNAFYFVDSGIFQFQLFTTSINTMDTSILLQFHMVGQGDIGSAKADFSGTQRDSLTYSVDTGILVTVQPFAAIATGSGGRSPVCR
jgi:hypothetical protein